MWPGHGVCGRVMVFGAGKTAPIKYFEVTSSGPVATPSTFLQLLVGSHYPIPTIIAQDNNQSVVYVINSILSASRPMMVGLLKL